MGEWMISIVHCDRYAGLVGLIGSFLINVPEYLLPPSGEITMDTYELRLFGAIASLKTSAQFHRLLAIIGGHQHVN